MKHLSIVGTFAIALVSLFATTPVQAQTPAAVTCHAVFSGTGWPNNSYTQWCSNGTDGVMAADGNDAWDALDSLSNHGANAFAQFQLTLPTFYVFGTHAEYTAYFTAHGLTPVTVPAGALGYTPFMGNNYSLIFKTPKNGVTNGNITPTTAHEAGHWMDYFEAKNAGPDGGTTLQSSTTANFKAELAQDFANLDVPTLAPCGSGGYFTGQLDSVGVSICNGNVLSTKYSGLKNHEVLPKAWKSYFGSTIEMWAEEDVIIDGYTRQFPGMPNENPDVPYLNTAYYYGCSKTMNMTLIQYGRLPMANEYPAGANCPLVHNP